MTANKCDRCETLYEREYTPDVRINIYSHPYGDEWVDLCPKCQEKLEQFVANCWQEKDCVEDKTDQSCIPAEIWFKPTCSSCEKQLNLMINYEEEIENFTEAKPNFALKNYTITPSHCPFCGKRFETIVMPVSLPYDNRKAKRYNYKPQCNHCEYYKGTFDAKGFAGCSERKTIAVAWDDWCPAFKMQAILATED